MLGHRHSHHHHPTPAGTWGLPPSLEDEDALDARIARALEQLLAAYAPRVAEAGARFRGGMSALLAALDALEAGGQEGCVARRVATDCGGVARACPT